MNTLTRWEKHQYQQRTRIDAAFERAKLLPQDRLELQSDFARYLTVLVYGYLEESVRKLLEIYVDERAAPPVTAYVEGQLRRGPNMKSDSLLKLLNRFDPTWTIKCGDLLDKRSRQAIDTVTDNRNRLSHGDWIGKTMGSISSDYQQIRRVIEKLPSLLEGPAASDNLSG